jgi:hypothetical protein
MLQDSLKLEWRVESGVVDERKEVSGMYRERGAWEMS